MKLSKSICAVLLRLRANMNHMVNLTVPDAQVSFYIGVFEEVFKNKTVIDKDVLIRCIRNVRPF